MREFTFDEVWVHLEETAKRLHEALLDAISNADRMVIQHPELCPDGNMWSQHVRAFLANALLGAADDEGFRMERRFNISLTLSGHGLSCRIRKAALGKMPQPGTGIGSIDFFNQNQGQLVLPGTELNPFGNHHEPERAMNFIFKWAVDQDRQLTDFMLGYPKPTVRGLGRTDVPQEWFWVQDIFELTKPSFDHGARQDEVLDVPDVALRTTEEDSATGKDQRTGTV